METCSDPANSYAFHNSQVLINYHLNRESNSHQLISQEVSDSSELLDSSALLDCSELLDSKELLESVELLDLVELSDSSSDDETPDKSDFRKEYPI